MVYQVKSILVLSRILMKSYSIYQIYYRFGKSSWIMILTQIKLCG